MAPSRTDTNGNGEFTGSYTPASEVKITGFEAHGKTPHTTNRVY
jgi:L-galactonate dehydratase